MTYQSLISPLALTAGTGLYGNVSVPAAIGINVAFVTQATTYDSGLAANLVFSVNLAATSPALAISSATLTRLKTIGRTVAPALGDTFPANVTATIANSMAVGQMVSVGQSYISNVPKFLQAFGTADGYIGLTNQIIESVVNANNYLGPTFTSMDDLITANLSRVNAALQPFGEDLGNLGELINFERTEFFGTPAALLGQISLVGNMIDGVTPCLMDSLRAQGLTDQNIEDLVSFNIQSLLNPNGLTPVQYDELQRRAYPALVATTGPCLEEITDILDIAVPVTTAADLLDPVVIFPNSFASLTFPTPVGDQLIFNEDGSVNSIVEPILNSGTITPNGCDQLAKIIPPSQAAANRALQLSFAQVSGLNNITLPQLAAALR